MRKNVGGNSWDTRGNLGAGLLNDCRIGQAMLRQDVADLSVIDNLCHLPVVLLLHFVGNEVGSGGGVLSNVLMIRLLLRLRGAGKSVRRVNDVAMNDARVAQMLDTVLRGLWQVGKVRLGMNRAMIEVLHFLGLNNIRRDRVDRVDLIRIVERLLMMMMSHELLTRAHHALINVLWLLLRICEQLSTRDVHRLSGLSNVGVNLLRLIIVNVDRLLLLLMEILSGRRSRILHVGNVRRRSCFELDTILTDCGLSSKLEDRTVQRLDP